MSSSINSSTFRYIPNAPHGIPTIEEFKSKFESPILSSQYIVTFDGPFFNKINANGTLECKVVSISTPNYQIDNEQIYIGGTSTSVPSGLTKGNLDITIINQGIEYQTIYSWMKQIYDPYTRRYGYFDDIKTKIILTQYKTNGVWVLEHHYYDCTPYNLQVGQFSYDQTDISKFTLSMNYFAYECVYNDSHNKNNIGYRNAQISYFEKDTNVSKALNNLGSGVSAPANIKVTYDNKGTEYGPYKTTDNYDGTR